MQEIALVAPVAFRSPDGVYPLQTIANYEVRTCARSGEKPIAASSLQCADRWKTALAEGKKRPLRQYLKLGESEPESVSEYSSAAQLAVDRFWIEKDTPTPATLMYLAHCIANAGECAGIKNGIDKGNRPCAIIENFRTGFSDWPKGDEKKTGNCRPLTAVSVQTNEDQTPIGPSAPSWDVEKSAEKNHEKKDGFDEISVLWGSSVPDHYADVGLSLYGERPKLNDRSTKASETKFPKPCLYEDGSDQVGLFFRQLFSKSGTGGSSLIQPCGYHLSIPYVAIENRLAEGAMAKAVFNGRTLIVGGQFRNTPDHVNSVVHGRMSGMFFHAMALDNLMTDHDGFIRAYHTVESDMFKWLGALKLSTLDFAETALLAFMIFIVGIGQFWLNARMRKAFTQEISRQAEGRERPLRRQTHGHVYLVIIVTVGIVLYLATIGFIKTLHLAPPNWIGLGASALAIFMFLARDEMSDDLFHLLSKLPVIGRDKTDGNQPSPIRQIIWRIKRFFDMETLGFGQDEPDLITARRLKTHVIETLYPHRGGQSVYPNAVEPVTFSYQRALAAQVAPVMSDAAVAEEPQALPDLPKTPAKVNAKAKAKADVTGPSPPPPDDPPLSPPIIETTPPPVRSDNNKPGDKPTGASS